MKMLNFYSRNCKQLSLWTYGDFKPTLLPCVHIWSNKVNPNLTAHVPCIFNEQLYADNKFFLSTFFSLLKKDKQSMLFTQFLLRS